MISDDVCEREIEVDGESATVSLLDTWDVEVRWRIVAADARSELQWFQLTAFLLVQTDSEWAREHFLQTADAFLLLYSVTDRASFLRASELRITLRRFRPAHRTPIILVGNKCDLVRRREVSVSGEATRSLSD